MPDRTGRSDRRDGEDDAPLARAVADRAAGLRRRPAVPSPEVVRVRALYEEMLRDQVRAGTYLTDHRVRVALERMVRSVEQDLPPE